MTGMGKVFDELDERLRTFIEEQQVFFVGSAPSGSGGHVNVSPKGGRGSLSVVDSRTLAYLDLIGSGAETIAHLRDNGRIVLMFCAFEGPPKIVRVHGRGEVLEPQSPRFAELRGLFAEALGTRSIIVVHAERISDSCGYAVPLYRFEGERRQLDDWAQRKGSEKLVQYQRDKNARSIDGLPALEWVEAPVPEGAGAPPVQPGASTSPTGSDSPKNSA